VGGYLDRVGDPLQFAVEGGMATTWRFRRWLGLPDRVRGGRQRPATAAELSHEVLLAGLSSSAGGRRRSAFACNGVIAATALLTELAMCVVGCQFRLRAVPRETPKDTTGLVQAQKTAARSAPNRSQFGGQTRTARISR